MLYQVHYFEAMLNLTTTNNSLLFQAQAVLDDTYVGNVTIIVTAINQFGIGESSNPVTEKICKLILYAYLCMYVATCVLAYPGSIYIHISIYAYGNNNMSNNYII